MILLDKLAPVIANKKFNLPSPTLCFDCRLQKRLAFYNCRKLYKRTCDYSGEPIISIFSPDKLNTVYDFKIWWSDKWNPMDYGRDFDFNRPFFEQFKELMESVPFPALSVMGDNVNSDYTNDNYKTKNSYLIFDGEQAENCYYGHTYAIIKDCMDFLHLNKSELCYECVHCYNCYKLFFGQYCHNCSESWFLRDCIACRNCFGCANLRQKQYYIFNEKKTKEEYTKFISSFKSSKHSVIKNMQQQCNKFFLSQPVKAIRGEQNINCLGDNLNNCKNAYYCFDCNEQHDTRYCSDCLMGMKDSMDVHVWGDNSELIYNSLLVGNQAQNIIAGYYVLIGVHNVYYSLWCGRGSSNLFGCNGLIHKQYCILNKQYTKEEYEKLVPKIIEHMQKNNEWGKFYPTNISMFGYNETMAQSFFPLKKDKALSQGFKWNDYEPPVEAERTIHANQLPDDLNDIPNSSSSNLAKEDNILNWAICCEKTGKPFRMITQELNFYRTHSLPIPRRHPDQRHFDRFKFKNPYKLWQRKCDKCEKDIQTSYAPERLERVFCEDCYLKEVY